MKRTLKAFSVGGGDGTADDAADVVLDVDVHAVGNATTTVIVRSWSSPVTIFVSSTTKSISMEVGNAMRFVVATNCLLAVVVVVVVIE